MVSGLTVVMRGYDIAQVDQRINNEFSPET